MRQWAWPVLALWLAGSGSLGAQQNAGGREIFRDWELLHLPQGECLLVQQVLARRGEVAIADVYLSRSEAGSALLSVRVPVGVSLADGIGYRYPDRPEVVPLIWQSCNSGTCLAQIQITGKELARLQAAREIRIAFVPVRDARPLVFSLSLMGLTRGMQRLAACQPDG